MFCQNCLENADDCICEMITKSIPERTVPVTMPHLENCRHSETGWCLDCVKTLHDEKDVLAIRVEVARNILSKAIYGPTYGSELYALLIARTYMMLGGEEPPQ